jgi:hypothetical protein
MKVKFQKLQDLFHGLLSVLGDSTDVIGEEGITASFILFFDQAQENTVFDNILSLELGSLIEFHELFRVPALEAGTLRRPILVDAAGLLLCSVERAASFFVPDFNHLLNRRDDPSMNIVPNQLTFAKGIQTPQADKSANHLSQILRVQSRAGLEAAFPATDTVISGLL